MHSSQILPFLRYKIQRPYHNGHGIHSPFLYRFVTMVLYARKEYSSQLNDIDGLRRQLKVNHTTLTIEDFGAGSTALKTTKRSINQIFRHSSSSKKYGILLQSMTRFFQPSGIIELGTCLGLGTLYLSTGCSTAKVVTIEGCKALAEQAALNFQQLHHDNIHQLIGNFDGLLPQSIKLSGTCDFVFIDGNHTKEATLDYFHFFVSVRHEKTVLVFDDIRWSQSMKEAWDIICGSEQVTLSLDLFQMGIVFFDPALKKQHFLVHY